MFAREAWMMLEENFETVLRNPADLDARGSMQMGAFLAGTAIENSMLGAAHALANPLTAHYGITHGIAIGIVLPHVVCFNAPAAGPLYGDLAHESGLVNGDTGVAAEAVARRIADLVEQAGLPTVPGRPPPDGGDGAEAAGHARSPVDVRDERCHRGDGGDRRRHGLRRLDGREPVCPRPRRRQAEVEVQGRPHQGPGERPRRG